MSERPDKPEVEAAWQKLGATYPAEPPLCPTHGKPPVIMYPCCGGAKGGKASTRIKRKRARENLALARQKKATP